MDRPYFFLDARCWLIGWLLVGLTGCVTTPIARPLDPIPLQQAIDIVNNNSQKIHATLRAVGPVDGHFTTENGARRSFHVDGTLFYLEPLYLRFDLKSFGDRQFLFGSNAEKYWIYSKADGQTYCGPHGKTATLPAGLSVRPEQIVGALGLSPIYRGSSYRKTHAGSTYSIVHFIQRVVEKYQQVLLVELGDDGHVNFEKEYWLDRYEPRLVRRVVFRNTEGIVEMTSDLSGYKRLGSDGPWLPSEMTVNWPRDGASMSLKVRRWKFVEQVGPKSIQFATPRDCQAIARDNQSQWQNEQDFGGQRLSTRTLDDRP